MRGRWVYIVALATIVLLTGYFNLSSLNSIPMEAHAWAQTDHYSLALGFERNGLNFFKPETFVMNHQFPYNFLRPAKNSITAVDFPIHEYIPALFMKLFHSRSPLFFRLYVLLLSVIGLFYLFRLALLITGDELLSLGMLVWSATVPVFALFQGSFMPSIPSLSLMTIGMYYYFHHVETQDKKPFITAILFLTIAALTRKTFAIPLVAIGGYEIIKTFRNPKYGKGYKLNTYIALLLVFLGYQVYNHYLFYNYGSVFLNYFLPPHNWVEVQRLLSIIWSKWLLTFGSPFHYVLLFSALVLLGFNAKKIITGNNTVHKSLLFISSLMIIGDLIFFVMMMKQWEHHDYYLNDTFFLPTFILLSLALAQIPKKTLNRKSVKLGWAILILITGLYGALYAKKIKQNRANINYHSRTYTTFKNFSGTEKFLDSLGVSKAAKILVLDAYAPNLPFLLMNRKGMAIMSTTVRNLDETMKWHYDLLALQDTFILSDIYPNAPQIINKFEKIATNGKVSFFKRLAKDKIGSIESFIGLDTTTRAMHSLEKFEHSYDSTYHSEWEYLRIVKEPKEPQNSIMYFKEGEEFGMKWEHPCPNILHNKSFLLFNGRFKAFTEDVIYLAVTYGQFITNDTLYRDKLIRNQLFPYKKWRSIAIEIPLDPIPANLPDCTLRIYLWNKNKRKLFLDDVELSIYPYK